MWWGLSLILVVAFVGRPTNFEWPRWLYGLIWGAVTTGGIYLFRDFFEEEVEDPHTIGRNRSNRGT